MSKYETLEDALVALFPTAETFFDIAPLPDNEVEFRPQQPRPQVYVSYDGSDFTDPQTSSKVSQEERLNIGFEIHAKTRRGAKGITAIFEAICVKVYGVKFLGYDRFSLVKFGPLAGSGANKWNYYAQFTTTTRIVDQQPDPDYTVNILTDPEFVIQAAI